MVIVSVVLLVAACLFSLLGVGLTLWVSRRQTARLEAAQVQADEVLRLLSLHGRYLERLELQKAATLPALPPSGGVYPLVRRSQERSEAPEAPFSLPEARKAPAGRVPELKMESWRDVRALGEAQRRKEEHNEPVDVG